MPDPQQKIVKVDSHLIAFPGDMEDEHVSRLVRSFRETKRQSVPVTEESEHIRQLKVAQPPPSLPSWVTTPKVFNEVGAALWPKQPLPPDIEAANRRAAERVKQFDVQHPVAAGALQGATNVIDSLRNPLSIGLMIAAPESKLLSGIFAMQAAQGAFHSAQDARDAYKASKNPEAFRQLLRWTSGQIVPEDEFNKAWAQHLLKLKFQMGQKAAEATADLGIAGTIGAHAVRGTAVNPEGLRSSGQGTIEGEGKPVPVEEIPRPAPQIVPARPLTLPEIQRVRIQAEALNPIRNGKSVIPKLLPTVPRSESAVVPRETSAPIPRPESGQISVDANFPPLKEHAPKWQKASQNENLAKQFARLGISGFSIDAPYKFGLSEQGNIDRGTGKIQISAAASDPEHTLAHEIAHDIYNRLSPENKAVIDRYVQSSTAYSEHAGGLEERVSDHFADALLGRDYAPVSIKKIFFESPLHNRPEAKRLPEVSEPKPVHPAMGRNWGEVAQYGGALRQGDDIEALVKADGDFPLVVKDITGARHVAPASVVAQIMKDPIVDGYVDQVFMAKDHIAEESNKKLQDDINTIQGMLAARRFVKTDQTPDGKYVTTPTGPPMSEQQVPEWEQKLATLQAEIQKRTAPGYQYRPVPSRDIEILSITQGGSRPLVRALETVDNARRLQKGTQTPELQASGESQTLSDKAIEANRRQTKETTGLDITPEQAKADIENNIKQREQIMESLYSMNPEIAKDFAQRDPGAKNILERIIAKHASKGGSDALTTGHSGVAGRGSEPESGGAEGRVRDAAIGRAEGTPPADERAVQASAEAVEKPTKYKYGNTQADVPQGSEAGKALLEARSSIDKNDLAGKGIEDDPHITVRYGIDGEDTEGIRKYLESQPPFEATLGPVTAFPVSEHSEGAAPIVVSVESPDLHKMEKEIDDHGNFVERSFPDYKPHITLAYIKPEAADKYVGMAGLEGKKFTINSVSISKKDGSTESVPLLGKPKERRVDTAKRKRIADMSAEEMRKILLTSDVVDLPNRRSFDEAQHDHPAKFVARSDADGLKAFNDKFGYEMGNALLRAKAEALKQAGLDAYHEKGDEFLYRGESEDDLKARLEKAREILHNTVFDVTLEDGTKLTLKGVDFSHGTGKDLREAEQRQHEHKGEREQRGERARGELRGITETRTGPN